MIQQIKTFLTKESIFSFYKKELQLIKHYSEYTNKYPI